MTMQDGFAGDRVSGSSSLHRAALRPGTAIDFPEMQPGSWQEAASSGAGSPPAVSGRSNKPVIAVELLALTLKFADILTLILSGAVASRECRLLGVASSGGEWMLTALVTSLTSLFVVHQAGAYQAKQLGRLGFRVPAILVATTAGCLSGMGCAALMPVLTPALRLWPLVWMPSTTLLMVATALMGKIGLDWLATTERLTRRIAIVGRNGYGEDFARRVDGDPKRAASVFGFYSDGSEAAAGSDSRDDLGNLDDLVGHARAGWIDAIVIAFPLHEFERLRRVRARLSSLNVDTYIAADVLDFASKAGRVDRIGDVAVLKISGSPLQSLDRLQKDVLDRLLAGVILLVSLPFLLLIALAIKMGSDGPALFRQPRLGFNNEIFQIYKFRTMYHHLQDLGADRQVSRDDSRITPLGRILRKTSIDELPQLLNVLRGEMSLVGPRPHAPNTKAGGQLFHEVVSDYAMRHRVKPGITGWAQVNGWRGETQTRDQIEGRVACDLYYIDNWSILLDVKILILTAIRELNSKVAF